MMQTFLTASSAWTFNEEDKTFVRTPREEGAGHPNVHYSQEAVEFDYARLTHGRVFVYREGQVLITSGSLVEGTTFEDIA